jgi:drug/metabolite transporter (DMT)-like permease
MRSYQMLSIGIGVIAVIMFAGTFPSTKLALDIYSPVLETCLRALSASVFAVIFLIISFFFNGRRKQILTKIENPKIKHLSTIINTIPSKAQMRDLFFIGIMLVFGFPGAVAFALAEVSSSYSAVVLAMLPLCLSAAGVLIAKERPPMLFWACSIIAALLVSSFMLKSHFSQTDSLTNASQNIMLGNFWLFIACLCAAVGYTKSASLNKQMSGFAVISWGLCLTAPISILFTYFLWPNELPIIDAMQHRSSFWGVIYLGLFSMFIGNCLWSIALSRGGIAKIGQLQFLQPFMTLYISFWLLNELITFEMFVFAASVTMTVLLGQRQRFKAKLVS